MGLRNLAFSAFLHRTHLYIFTTLDCICSQTITPCPKDTIQPTNLIKKKTLNSQQTRPSFLLASWKTPSPPATQMPSNVVSPILLLLLPFSCMVSMHACNARHIGIPGFQFEHQKLLGHHPGQQIEVDAEEELRESLLSSKFTEPIYSSTGWIIILNI